MCNAFYKFASVLGHDIYLAIRDACLKGEIYRPQRVAPRARTRDIREDCYVEVMNELIADVGDEMPHQSTPDPKFTHSFKRNHHGAELPPSRPTIYIPAGLYTNKTVRLTCC